MGPRSYSLLRNEDAMKPCDKGEDLRTRLSALLAQMDSKHSSPELQEAVRLLGELRKARS